ncbi:MAG: ribonuclease HI family protein [Polyangiales bacterium]
MSAATWRIHCDGAALPNLGALAVGVVIVAPDGTRHEVSRLVGRGGCCNEGEALALIVALQAARSLGARSIDVSCDSTIIIDHAFDGATTTVARLARLYAEARALLAEFDEVAVRWVPRRLNAEADALARAALGLGARVAVARKKKRRRR